jgi:hypothetical protein
MANPVAVEVFSVIGMCDREHLLMPLPDRAAAQISDPVLGDDNRDIRT